MDFAINVAYTNGDVDFKSPELKKATAKLFSEMGKSKKSFCTAAKELEKIRDGKLYEQDFLDTNGKPSFAEYCAQVLNISKSKAYSIIKTANTLLVPEIISKEKEEYFTQFSESNLSILASVGEYDEVVRFCEENNIDESTTTAELKKIMATKKEDAGSENTTEGKDGQMEIEVEPEKKSLKDSFKEFLEIIQPKALNIADMLDEDERRRYMFLWNYFETKGLC